MHVSNGAIAHGNECQDVTLGVAGCCMHGRSLTESAAAAAQADAGQRVSNQATITSTTMATSTNVTCDRGMPGLRFIGTFGRCDERAATPGCRDRASHPVLTRWRTRAATP